MLVLIGAVLFSYYFIHIALIPSKIKGWLKYKPHQRLKPFDCMTCLSVWSAVVLFFFPDVAEFFTIVFGAGFIGNIKLK